MTGVVSTEAPRPAARPTPTGSVARLSIVQRTGDGVQSVADQTVVPARAADRLTAQGQFAPASLAPGTYEIKATVFVAGQAVGTVSTTVRKADKGGSMLSQGHVAPTAR